MSSKNEGCNIFCLGMGLILVGELFLWFRVEEGFRGYVFVVLGF